MDQNPWFGGSIRQTATELFSNGYKSTLAEDIGGITIVDFITQKPVFARFVPDEWRTPNFYRNLSQNTPYLFGVRFRRGGN